MKRRLAQVLICSIATPAIILSNTNCPSAMVTSGVEAQLVNEIRENEKLETYVMTEEDISEELYYDSLEYLAMCVEAEAGNQGYLGKVYVTDCILNRYDAGNYATFYEVINEPGQFACVRGGDIDIIPSEETYEVVASELENRTNSEILYFRTGYYHKFATNCFVYGDHYFSK